VALGTWIVTVAAPVVLKKLAEWALAFVQWVAPLIPPMLVELGKILIRLGDWILTEALPAIVKQLAEWGAAFVGWIATDVIPKLPGALDAVVTALGTFITDTATWLLTEAAKLGASIIDGIIKGINDLAGKVGSALRAMVTNAMKSLPSIQLPGISLPGGGGAAPARSMAMPYVYTPAPNSALARAGIGAPVPQWSLGGGRGGAAAGNRLDVFVHGPSDVKVSGDVALSDAALETAVRPILDTFGSALVGALGDSLRRSMS